MKLIDADALHRKVKMETNPYGKPTIDYDSGVKVLEWIEQAPTVDAVEVVRCRECKFGTHFGDMEDEWINCTNLHGKPLMPFDGFCSYGERKEGADNG